MARKPQVEVRITGNATGLQRALGSASRSLQQAGRKMTDAGQTLTRRLTLPILGVGAASVKAFADFDDAMTKSLAIMGEISGPMRAKMEAAARSVGKTTTFGANQAAEAFFFLASAGLSAQQSLKALPAVARFAQAGNFDLAQATDLATDAQNALGLTSKNAAKNLKNLTRVTDVLAKADNIANASVLLFAEAMTNRAGAAAKALGKDVEETTAVLAAFAAQGIKGREAGTQLSIVWRDLQTKAIKNKDAFKKFNVAVFDANGEMRNTADIVEDLEDALKDMSDRQKKATLIQLGFTDRSIASMMALLGTSDAIRAYEQDLKNAGGTTEEVAKKQLESFSARLKLLKGRVTDVGITIGGVLAPHLEKLADKLEGLVNWFKDLDKQQQRNILKWAAVAAAIGPVLIISGKLVLAIKAISTALTFLAAHPVVAAIAAIAAALVIAYKESETFRKAVHRLVEAGGELWTALQPLVDLIGKALAGAMKVVIPVITGVVNVMASLVGWVATAIEKITRLIDLLAELNPLSSVKGRLGDAAKELLENQGIDITPPSGPTTKPSGNTAGGGKSPGVGSGASLKPIVIQNTNNINLDGKKFDRQKTRKAILLGAN